ncbi:MAG TPA: hypothetical protein VG603_12270, partial [Chitinophagales bacterium]|nr:hypothetical protein [Chitinophagales bacterium]
MTAAQIAKLLGEEKANYLLSHQSKTISKDQLHLPSGDFVDAIWKDSDRSIPVLRSLQTIANNGRLGGS